MEPEQFMPIDKPKLTTEKVYSLLHNSIITLGLLKPGQELSENILAKQLKVSRTPVREAFKRLEQEGLVQTIPQKGTVVLKLCSDTLKEAAQLRCILEEWAAGRAVDLLNETDIEKMRSIQPKIQDSFIKKDFIELLRLDTEFHKCFLRVAGNREIIKTITQMNNQLYRLRVLWLRTGQHVDDWGLKPHTEIITAFQQKDRVHLKNAISIHLRFDDIINEMQRAWPEYFD